MHLAFDDTKLILALEPNFREKLIVGGPSPECHILPWPTDLPEKDYKTEELVEAIMKQYASDIEPPNICKLAVLVFQK